MALKFEMLQAEVLGLAPADRARLLQRLIASLDVDSDMDDAWEQEADRREALLDSGAQVEVPGPQSIERLRNKLAP